MRKPGKMLGVLLLLTGSVLLTENLGFYRMDWNLIWPAILLVYGLYLYFKFYQNRSNDDLIFATILTGIGIATFALPPGLSWEQTLEWWPVCPFFWGLGIFFVYLTNRKDSGSLFLSLALMAAGAFFLADNFKWAQSYLKYWPIILMMFGIISIFNKSIPNKDQA